MVGNTLSVRTSRESLQRERAVAECVPMLKPYIVYFKYKIPGEKAAAAVKQFRIYAANLDEARRLAGNYANYPNIDIVEIRSADTPLS